MPSCAPPRRGGAAAMREGACAPRARAEGRRRRRAGGVLNGGIGGLDSRGARRGGGRARAAARAGAGCGRPAARGGPPPAGGGGIAAGCQGMLAVLRWRVRGWGARGVPRSCRGARPPGAGAAASQLPRQRAAVRPRPGPPAARGQSGQSGAAQYMFSPILFSPRGSLRPAPPIVHPSLPSWRHRNRRPRPGTAPPLPSLAPRVHRSLVAPCPCPQVHTSTGTGRRPRPRPRGRGVAAPEHATASRGVAARPGPLSLLAARPPPPEQRHTHAHVRPAASEPLSARAPLGPKSVAHSTVH
jgi:hypothetical protein